MSLVNLGWFIWTLCAFSFVAVYLLFNMPSRVSALFSLFLTSSAFVLVLFEQGLSFASVGLFVVSVVILDLIIYDFVTGYLKEKWKNYVDNLDDDSREFKVMFSAVKTEITYRFGKTDSYVPEITLDTRFSDDLRLSSSDVFLLLNALENRYELNMIPAAERQDISSVRDMVRCLLHHMRKVAV